MSRLISDILNASEPHFSHTIRDLELMSGRAGHDVRLVSELSQLKKHAVTNLGFDDHDVNSKELYYALRHKSAEINASLEKQLRITSDTSTEELAGSINKFIDSMTLNREVWVVKHSVIKLLLKKQPPKKLMKALGLRSIDSVLKRTSSYELLALAYQVEGAEWKQKMLANFRKLKPSDFQSSKSSVFRIETDKVDKLHKAGYKKHNIVISSYESGSVLLLSPAKRFPQDTLALTLGLLQALYDLRVYSAYFRFIAVKPSFGLKLHSALTKGLPGGLGGNQIGWRALQKYFNQHPEKFGIIEQPHLQYDDIHLVSPTEALHSHIVESTKWDHPDHGFISDVERPISLNLMDVVTNASNQLTYETGLAHHGRVALWDELSRRYLDHDQVVGIVINILDDDEDG